jgi:penicillin-binding protein 1A
VTTSSSSVWRRSVPKDAPPEPFKAPANAKYAMIRGVREAFRPGTEPAVVATPVGQVAPIGPQPYNKVWQNGITGAPSAAGAVAPPPAAPPPKKPDDVTGLY